MSINELKARMGMSFQIGRLFGVPVKVHVSMIILLVVLAIKLLMLPNGTIILGLVALLLLSTLLHELGHVYVAQRYGVRPIDIWLSPIGGQVRYERMPKNPTKELHIAAAGPLVNLALAAISIAVFYSLQNIGSGGWFLLPKYVAGLNLFYAAFNLIPAFPLDGGRVLRALRARNRTRLQATRLPVLVGRWFAILLVIGVLIFAGKFFIFALVVAVYIWVFTEIEWWTVKQQAARGESDDDAPEDEGLKVGPAPYER